MEREDFADDQNQFENQIDLTAAAEEEDAEPLFTYPKREFEKGMKVDNPEATCWYYFTPTMIGDKPGYRCDCCSKYTSTSLKNVLANLRGHLANGACTKYSQEGAKALQIIADQQKKDTPKLSDAKQRRLTSMGLGKSVADNQGLITSHVTNLSPSVVAQFKDALARWVYECCSTISFNSLQHPAFNEALKVLGIQTGMDRKRLAGPLLDAEYLKTMSSIKNLVAEEKMYQISTDAWKRNLVNEGYKLLGACINFPNGRSTFANVTPTEGESLNASFLKDYLQGVIHYYGAKACISIVADGERAVQNAVEDLERVYPHMCNFKCQAHCLSLLIGDFLKKDRIIEWVMDVVHSLVKLATGNGEFKQVFKQQQRAHSCVKYIRVGVETRFGTRVFELEDVLRCKAAFEATANTDELRNKLAEGSKATADAIRAFQYARNGNFWIEAKKVLALLQPIKNAIYCIEGDKPVVSQVRNLWQEVYEHAMAWTKEHRPRYNEDAYGWDNAYGVPPSAVVPASINDLTTLLVSRFNYSMHPAFSLAYLLDCRFWVKEEVVENALYSYKPDQSFLVPEEIKGVTELAQRLVDNPDLKLDIARELFVFLKEGTAEDFSKLPATEIKDGKKCFRFEPLDVKIAWETVLKQRYPVLATLVDGMMSMHATSCSSERLWSTMRWIYRENRTRLAVERAKKMAFISANRRLLRKRKAPEGKEEDGMDLLLEIALDDPEPSVQE